MLALSNIHFHLKLVFTVFHIIRPGLGTEQNNVVKLEGVIIPSSDIIVVSDVPGSQQFQNDSSDSCIPVHANGDELDADGSCLWYDVDITAYLQPHFKSNLEIGHRWVHFTSHTFLHRLNRIRIRTTETDKLVEVEPSSNRNRSIIMLGNPPTHFLTSGRRTFCGGKLFLQEPGNWESETDILKVNYLIRFSKYVGEALNLTVIKNSNFFPIRFIISTYLPAFYEYYLSRGIDTEQDHLILLGKREVYLIAYCQNTLDIQRVSMSYWLGPYSIRLWLIVRRGSS
ncbi:unnamed protein product [Orchesella dallaii]|uniref:Uncharacterized protein n=1 Tax=Orchesella dallaii TaxID=48710 RepID=A0ABP1RBQ7_9HEXA